MKLRCQILLNFVKSPGVKFRCQILLHFVKSPGVKSILLNQLILLKETIYISWGTYSMGIYAPFGTSLIRLYMMSGSRLNCELCFQKIVFLNTFILIWFSTDELLVKILMFFSMLIGRTHIMIREKSNTQLYFLIHLLISLHILIS